MTNTRSTNDKECPENVASANANPPSISDDNAANAANEPSDIPNEQQVPVQDNGLRAVDDVVARLRRSAVRSWQAAIAMLAVIIAVIVGSGWLIYKASDFAQPRYPTDELEWRIQEIALGFLESPLQDWSDVETCEAALSAAFVELDHAGFSASRAVTTLEARDTFVKARAKAERTASGCIRMAQSAREQNDLSQVAHAVTSVLPEEIDVESSLSDWAPLLTRFTIAGLTVFLVQMLWSAYRSSIETSRYLDRSADILQLAGFIRGPLSVSEYAKITRAWPGFEPSPRSPTEHVAEITAAVAYQQAQAAKKVVK